MLANLDESLLKKEYRVIPDLHTLRDAEMTLYTHSYGPKNLFFRRKGWLGDHKHIFGLALNVQFTIIN